MSLIDSYAEYVRRMNERIPNALALKVRRLLTYVFIGLVVADIIFVLLKPFPTISQVVLDSSPKYMILIWLFVVVTANLFFPISKRLLVYPQGVKVLSLSCMFFLLAYAGHRLSQYKQLDSIDSSLIESITIDRCTNIIDGAVYRVNCDVSSASPYLQRRVDLKTSSKLGLLFIGFLSGLLFTPQILMYEH